MSESSHGSMTAFIVRYVLLVCVDGEVKARDAFSGCSSITFRINNPPSLPQGRSLWSGFNKASSDRAVHNAHIQKLRSKFNIKLEQDIWNGLCINKSVLLKKKKKISFQLVKKCLHGTDWMDVEIALNPLPTLPIPPVHETPNIMRRENTNKPQMFHCNETSCK